MHIYVVRIKANMKIVLIMICKSIFLIHLNLKTLFMSISISNHHQMTYKSAYGNMDRQRVNFWYLFNKLTLRHWCCLLFLCSTTVHHCILQVPIILHYQMSLDLLEFGYLNCLSIDQPVFITTNMHTSYHSISCLKFQGK